MAISHESVYSWWEKELDDTARLEVANTINDQTVLGKSYNELSQDQQDLILSAYWQMAIPEIRNKEQDDELGVLSGHGEDKGWTSYPAGTSSFESKAKEDYDYRDMDQGDSSLDGYGRGKEPYDWFDGQGEFIIDTVKEDLYQAIKNAGYYGIYYNDINSGWVLGDDHGWETVKAKEELEREGKIRKGSVYDKFFEGNMQWIDKEPENYYFDSNLDLNRTGESKATEDYKTYQRSMDKALGLKSVDSHYKSDGITCGICGETPSDKREHLRKHYGAYFDEIVASESKANEGVWYTVSSTISGEYSEEEVEDLDEAKKLADDVSGVVVDNNGERVHVSDGYRKARDGFTESKASEYNPMAFINKQIGLKSKLEEAKIERDEGSMTIDGQAVQKIWESFSGWYWYGIENTGDGRWYGYVQGMENEWGYFDENELNSMEGQVWEVPKENWAWTGRESYAKEDSYESPMIEKGQQYTKDLHMGFKRIGAFGEVTILVCELCGWEAGELSDHGRGENDHIYRKLEEHVASVHGLVRNNWAESYVRKVKYTGNEGISLAEWSRYQDENGWYRVGVSSPTPEIEDIARSMGGNYYGLTSDGYGVEEWSFHNYSDAENFAQYVEGKSNTIDYGSDYADYGLDSRYEPSEQHYVSGPQDISPHIITGDGQDINIGSGAIGGHPRRDDPFGIGEAVRGKYDSWKKQDIDVRDETLDFAGVNAEIKEEILSTDMTLDEIKDGYPEEFKKLEQAGVWGFGESLSASEQWSDEEWFTEIEKLASGSGVKRIPVENFLMTLDGQTRVQAEMNFENDASVYGWNGETQEAISKGISKYFSKESKANEYLPDHFDLDEQRMEEQDEDLSLEDRVVCRYCGKKYDLEEYEHEDLDKHLLEIHNIRNVEESKAKKQGKEYNLGKQSSDAYDIIIYDKETGDWEMSIDVDNQTDLKYYRDDFKQEANRLNDEAGYKKYAVKVKNEWDTLNWSQDFSEEKVKAKEVAEKLAYYFSKGDKPIDWNDNEISNDAEKILQETYGITTKKPEVAKEVAHESHSPTQERIIDRKLAGVKHDGIIHELMLWENMSEEQATKAVESTEIPVMDSVSFSLFNKKYSELNEVEQQEIKLYGGEAKKVNKEKDGGIV